MQKTGRLYILLSVALFSLAVTAVDAFLHPAYVTKVFIKIAFFLLLPTAYFLVNRADVPRLRALFRFKKKAMLLAIALGCGIYAVIVGGYFLTRGIFDYSGVADTLLEKHGISAENFLWVSLYISLLNSFLEEYFFRGFGFLTLKAHTSRAFAYLFSPIFFAVYHAGMLGGMFHPLLLALVFLGLFLGGAIFNYLNETSGTIYPSWIAHACANFGMNTVGAILVMME